MLIPRLAPLGGGKLACWQSVSANNGSTSADHCFDLNRATAPSRTASISVRASATSRAAARWYGPLSEQGRAWPQGEVFEGELHIGGYSLEGEGNRDSSKVPLANLFKHLPVAALKAGYAGAAKLPAKRSRQFA